MSITPSDVRQLVDQHPGIPPIRQEEIDRIVRILNAHRHPAPSTGVHPTPDARRPRRAVP